MLWEGSDDAVVCLHSGLSVPRSTECSRRKQQELLKSHSQTLHSAWACSAPLLGIDSHPKAMGFGSWSHQEVSFGAPQVLVAVSGQSLPKTQQRLWPFWHTDTAALHRQGKSWKHHQVPQTSHCRGKCVQGAPAAASQQWALLTGTRAASCMRHSSAHKVTVSRHQRSYLSSLT